MEAKVRGIPLHYEEVGEGRPLLMLHGWQADHRHMLHDMEPLFAHRAGWRRLYPDLPGMGKTPGAAWITSQDHMLEVALGFLNAVAPDTRFAVAGVSLGGYLARGIVRQRPAQVEGVMLCVPVVAGASGKIDRPQHQVLAHDPGFVSALEADEEWLLDMMVVQSPAVLAEFRQTYKPAIDAADQDLVGRVEANYNFSFDVDNLPEPCAAPTLIVSGRQDSNCGYRGAWSLLENFPRATFAVLDRAGHALPMEQKVLYHALVSEWLDRVEEYSAGNSY
ncbi:MAG: alpha/beta hydrolase [Chloroflexota bacterium]|nr:alpha/beta hydrolase [Chloroflexota bacterium]